MSWHLTLFFSLYLLLPSLHASEFPLTRENAVASALAENPTLKAARQRVAVAEARARWSGKLSDPELEFSTSSDQFGLNEDEAVIELAFSQSFPLTDRLAREREISRIDIALAEAEIREQEWELAAEVSQAVLELIYLSDQQKLFQQMAALRRETAASLQEAFDRGETSRLELTDQKLAVQNQELEIQRLGAELVAAAGSLKPKIGLNPQTEFRILPPLKGMSLSAGDMLDRETLMRIRPDLQLHVLEENRVEASVALARSERWQDVAFQIFMERELVNDEPMGLERNNFFGVGFSIPLPLRTPQARLTDEPLAELKLAQEETLASVELALGEIESLRQEWQERRKILDAISQDSLDLARSHVQEVREAWKSGQVSLIRLQQAQERVLEVEQTVLQFRYDLARTMESLRRATVAYPQLNPSESQP